jgi:hypothetical protein
LLVGIMLSFGVKSMAQGTPWSYVDLSTEMIEAHAKKENTDRFINIFKDCKIDQLAAQISTDQLRLTFWINVYNGYILHILRKNPSLYEDRSAFFAAKQVNIGGHMFSFADIEHGILRRSQHPLMLGYVKRWFVNDIEKKFRMDKRDYRVHFALNCGAKSCPSVYPYNYTEISNQLDKSAVQFLKRTTACSDNKCSVTSIFSWFRGDFGGSRKIYKVLQRYQIIEKSAPKPKISYSNYDWTLDLDNFINDFTGIQEK